MRDDEEAAEVGDCDVLCDEENEAARLDKLGRSLPTSSLLEAKPTKTLRNPQDQHKPLMRTVHSHSSIGEAGVVKKMRREKP